MLKVGRITSFILVFTIFNKAHGFQCSQCDSDLDPNCYDDPPAPQNCTSCSVFDQYTGSCAVNVQVTSCITEKRYINNTLVRVTRDCSPAMMRPTCNSVSEFTEEIRVCYSTCNYSGCNTASGGQRTFMFFTKNSIYIAFFLLSVLQNIVIPT